MTGAIITLLLFPLAGAAVARVAGRTSWFLLGLGVVGLLLQATLLLRVPIVPALIAIAVASIAVLVTRRSPSQDLAGEEPHPLATVLTVVPVIVLLLTTAVTPLHDYDGRAFWLLKAKAVAQEQRIDGPFFQGQTMYNPRNQYPLLVPIDAAAVMVASGDSDERQVRWIYPLALLAFALHARRWMGTWPAALLTWIPQFAVVRDGGAASAYNDVIVAAFAGCAFGELVLRESPVRFGLWLSFLTLTKNEGLPFALVLLIAGVIVFRRKVAPAAVPFGIALAMLLVWRSRIPPGDEENLTALVRRLPEKLDRFLPALSRMAGHMLRFELWGLLWIAVACALVVLVVQGRWRTAALPVFTLASMTFVYVAVYAVTTWIMNDLIDSSADRLLMHLAGPALYLIGLSARNR